MVLTIISLVVLSLLCFITINYILNLRSKIEKLEREKGRAEYNVNDLISINTELNRKILNLSKKNFKVGAKFFYPSGDNFRDELVGKRAMIVEITSSHVKSRLIDSKGDFIDDKIWQGSPCSVDTYIFEDGDSLKHKFV
jgi:hypothetical protein